LEELSIDWRPILKWILRKQIVRKMWDIFVWLQTLIIGG
jgi:hypothetical protein